MILWTTAAIAGVCPADGTAEAVRHAQDLEQALITRDVAAFERAARSLEVGMGCLTRVPDPHEVALLHRGMAWARHDAGDRTGTRRSLEAAREHEPWWTPPPGLFEPDSEAAAAWHETAQTEPVWVPLPPTERPWIVDGAPLGAIPTDQAFIAQNLDHAGRVSWSTYAWQVSDLTAAPTAAARRGPWAAATLGGSAAVAVGAAWATASWTAGRSYAASAGAATTTDGYDAASLGYRRATVGLALGEGLVGAGLVAVGTGALALLTMD